QSDYQCKPPDPGRCGNADPRGRGCTSDELTICADVPHSSAEGERDGESRYHQRRGVHQHIDDERHCLCHDTGSPSIALPIDSYSRGGSVTFPACTTTTRSASARTSSRSDE